jgi:hypothetical protein
MSDLRASVRSGAQHQARAFTSFGEPTIAGRSSEEARAVGAPVSGLAAVIDRLNTSLGIVQLAAADADDLGDRLGGPMPTGPGETIKAEQPRIEGRLHELNEIADLFEKAAAKLQAATRRLDTLI